MKDELLKLVPVPVKKLLQKTGKEGTQLIDLTTKDASAYGKYKAERTESGWMKYAKGLSHKS